MHRGDMVRYLGGTGDEACWIYGRVEACGQKTVMVRWENGVRNDKNAGPRTLPAAGAMPRRGAKRVTIQTAWIEGRP